MNLAAKILVLTLLMEIALLINGDACYGRRRRRTGGRRRRRCGKVTAAPTQRPRQQYTSAPTPKNKSAPKSSGSSGGRTPAEEACLKQHNDYRKIYGFPSLKWDSNIAKSAMKWAKVIRDLGYLKHTPQKQNTKGYGENLAMASSSSGVKNLGAEAVTRWYDEICEYDSTGWNDGKTGHFTQVVWKASRYVGCAILVDGNTVWTVAQYDPAGNMNMAGYWEDNVGAYNSRTIKDARAAVDCKAYFERKKRYG